MGLLFVMFFLTVICIMFCSVLHQYDLHGVLILFTAFI